LAPDRVRRRDDAGSHPEVVLLLHGFFQTRNIWAVMEERLRHDGYGVLSFHLGRLLWRFNTQPIDRTAVLVAQKIEAIAQRHGLERLHIVGHSKGGLIARRYVQDYGGARRVKSIVTLGTPRSKDPRLRQTAVDAG
jgi:triacylglycerol esterase/lipase EstA (alpha/beta hydrolase family)